VWSIVSVSSNTQSGLSLTSLAAAAQTIAANGVETWQVVVKFDPIANTIGGTQYQTSLQVVSNDPTQSTLDCTLTGNGVIPMTLTVASSVNGVNDSNPLVMNFASLHATGHQSIAGTVTLTNSGQLPLVIAQNGITLASGTNFQITGITSTTQANINLSSGTATIAPSATETWTISLLFQPTAAGTDNTTLTILSNDPTHGTEPIALNGTGLNQPGILVTTPKGGTNLPFGMVLNDGAAGHVGTQSFTITNIGLQTLTVAHNGIFLTNATGYALQSIVSSTAGSISLASSSATIAPNSAETWTVVVSFDPTANTSSTGTLTISSNDPVTPSTALALTGSGTTPTITLQPSSSGLPILYIPAGQVYNVSYTATDTADTSSTATITLSTSAGNSLPATGLSTITSIPYNASTNSYSWRPSTSLVGQEVYVYGAIQDGSVSAGSYSSQKIHIEPANSFNLLTTLETTSSAYTYQYTYNGTVYSGTQTLQPGTNVVSITTPLPGGGNATHQVTVTLVNSLQSAQSVTYDELNRLKTATNGNGITTSYSYDLGGDLLQTSASNGDAISYTYDNLKRKISMTDYTGTYFYDYDDLDRQTDVIFSTSGNKTDSANLTLSYQYDNANRVTDMVYPGGEHVVFTWDDGGRLKTVSDVTKSQLTTYNYDYTTGLLQSVQRANGTTTTYTYDGSARLDDIKNKLGSTVLSEYNYTLNASGNATSLLTTFANGSQKQEQYTYDGLNRLVQVIYGSSATASPNDKTVIFAYDGSGNCLTITTKVNGSVTAQINRSYSKQNQLTTVTDLNNNPVASYFYDSAGNRIQKVTPNGTTYYTYDERNLLTSVLSPDHYVTYGYNGLGVRVSQTLDGVTTDFVVDSIPKSFQVVQERVSGAITRSYVYGNDRLNCNPVTGSASYYLPDRLGSVRQITDPSGNITSTFAYDVYGNPQ
jgi:YD repeat-containing protein